MTVKKAVIPAAGLGTRLFPATKEQPKEMLPIFARGSNGQICVKPLLQLIFETLFEEGVREFCFIIGKAKRAIEDHFTPDYQVTKLLQSKGKKEVAEELERFYRMIEESTIVWVNQPEPKGFGDAVNRAQSFIKDENFIVYAGDDYIISPQKTYLKNLTNEHVQRKATATFIVEEVKNPRPYGVIEGKLLDKNNIFEVKKIVEKPKKPPSKLAVVAVYLFNPIIFEALKNVKSDVKGEIQLTDALQILINGGFKVYAIKLQPDELRVDIGTPETYWKALETSYKNYHHS
jgi:UTP--glucose-1-phosphate uridylyltransferase